MSIKLKEFFCYFMFIVVFALFPGQEIKAQYKILNTGVEYIDSLFLSLPLDANHPGENLIKIKEAVNRSNVLKQVRILTNIGIYYLGSEMIDSAKVYFQKGLGLSIKIKTEYYRTICLMGLARIHAVFAEYDESIEKLDQALIFTLKSDSAELKSNIYRIYGNTYWGMEIYDLALESYYKGLAIAEEYNLSQNIAAAYNNIGNIYNSIKDYENAQKYLRLALKIATEKDHKWVVAVSSNNIGSILTELGAFDSALYFYEISRITSSELGGRIHEGIVDFNIGETYLKLDSFELAKKFLTESYKIAIETDDDIGLANCLLRLGELELVNGNLYAAKQYLDSGLAITIKIGSFSLQQEAYKGKNEYFKKVNDSDSIVNCLENLLFLKDTLSRIENIENIARLEYKYKEKVATQEIDILQKEKEINKLLIFISSSIAILILLILGMFLSVSRRKNRELNRINSIIEEQQNLLKQKNSELTITQNNLEKMVYGKDKFITIMSHDLKNPVGAIRGFLELLLVDYGSFDDKKKIVFLKEIFKSIEYISLLIDNILYWINSQNKGIESKPEILNASARIEDNIALYSIMANWKKIKINNNTLEDHYIFADKNIFDTIIRNLLSNSLKFTEEGGEITFRSIQKDQILEIEIEDTGKGMSESQLAEILNTENEYSSAGTSNEKGTGLGIGLVNEFAGLMGATFSITSEEGIGTKFILNFPVSEK